MTVPVFSKVPVHAGKSLATQSNQQWLECPSKTRATGHGMALPWPKRVHHRGGCPQLIRWLRFDGPKMLILNKETATLIHFGTFVYGPTTDVVPQALDPEDVRRVSTGLPPTRAVIQAANHQLGGFLMFSVLQSWQENCQSKGVAPSSNHPQSYIYIYITN